MNRENIIRMAREAGLVNWEATAYANELERFAALVIANHPPQSYMTWQEGYEAGKQTERERILDICKEGLWDAEGIRYHLDNQEMGQA
jgi:hypothetical protein